ncbi:MAG TPA: M14 family metallopeptidase [Bdellovibrionota bacterium]|nr:M14 family metallopeptidase [Bdellovibrionota bacterium]
MNINARGCLAAIIALSAQANAAPKWIIEIPAPNKEIRSKITDLGYAIDEVLSDKVFVLGGDADVKKLSESGYKVTPREYQERFEVFESFGPGLVYHSYQDVVRELENLSGLYPQLVSLESLGKSHENRDMTMIRISGMSKAAAQTSNAPVIMYMGCHHAREHLSVEVPLMFAQYLAAEYAAGNAQIQDMLNTREVYIAPIINPDGHTYDFVGPSSRGKMWRKNRRNNGRGSFGVDLNRNYGYGWNTGGSSSDPDSEIYMGPHAFSEPETQAVKAFVDSQPRMTTMLSFHTFSELVLYPWGNSYDKIGQKDGDAKDLAVFEKMASNMSRWNNYTPQQSSELYIASGDTTDWAYGAHRIIAFTFELSPKSMWDGGFYPGTRAIHPTFQANLKPMLYLLEYADNPSRALSERVPSFDFTPARRGVPVASFQDLSL